MTQMTPKDNPRLVFFKAIFITLGEANYPHNYVWLKPMLTIT